MTTTSDPRNSVAIVSGAASGIGRATAQRLLAAGWRVAGVDLDAAVVEKEFPTDPGFLALGADISAPEAVAAVYAAALERFGHLDAVANVAGISVLTDTRLEDVDVEVFDRTHAVNMRGTFLMCKAAIAPLRANGGGAI